MKKRIFSLLLVCAMLLSLLPTAALADEGGAAANDGTEAHPYTLTKLGAMTRAEYTAAQKALGGTMYVTVGNYSYDKDGVLGNGERNDTPGQTPDHSKLNAYGENGYFGEGNDGANGKNIVFVGNSITSQVTGYESIDKIGTSLLLAVPAYTNVTFKGITFNNVMSFDYQLYTGPWSQLGELKFDGCTFNGIIVGAIAAQKLTFNGCTFNDYTNTVSANNSNPTWIRPAYGNWTKDDNEGQGDDFRSLTTINFTGNTVTSTRPVKFERISQWDIRSKVTATGNYFDISAQETDKPTEIKNDGLYLGAHTDANAFDLVVDKNTKSNNTAALYTIPEGKTSLPAGSTVKDTAGKDIELTDALKWKGTKDEGLTLKTAYTEAAVAGINGVSYGSLAEAVAAAKDGDTIKLLKDVNNGDGVIVPSDKNFTLDFDNHTYTVTQNLAGSEGTKSQCFQLLKNSTLTFKNGTIKANNENVAMIIQNYSNLTLENMLLYGASITRNDATIYTMSNNCGNVVIKDTMINTVSNGVAFDVYGGFGNYSDVTVTVTGSSEINGKIEVARGSGTQNKNTLAINGGTINGELAVTDNEKTKITISGGSFSQPVKEEYCADGFIPKDNGNGTYVVKPVQVEMTSKEDVQATGTEVKIGAGEDAKTIDIEAKTSEGGKATVDATVATKTAEAIGEVLDNTNVTSFADTNIDKATPATKRVQNVDSTGFDLSMVLNAVKEAAAAKEGITSSVTGNNEISVTAATAETFTDADVTKSISIDLTAAAVTTTKQEEQTVVSLSTTTFEVKPIATITVTKAGGETETIKAVIPNDAITAPITFRLPVPSNWTGSVTVYHENEYYTTCPIQQAGTEAAYVELASKTFSSWTIENEEFEDEDAVAKTDTMYFDSLAEALEAATNGQTVTVLKNCTLNKEVFITNKAITLDLNNCTVAVNTPSIGVPIHVGKKDSTQGAELTVKNGIVNGTTATDGNVFGVYGMTTDNGAAKRTLTLDGVTLNANEYGVVVNNNSNHGYGAKITVENGSKINSGKSAVAINGKIQDTTGNVPEFVVNGSTLKVTKTNGVYSDEGNAIYAAGYAKWDIDNSTITGATGIYAKAGTFDIDGGTITAEGDAKAPVAYGNGGKSTGDGIIMDSKTGYAGNMTMDLNGVTVSSVNGNAVHEALTDKTTTSTQSIAITGGSFTAAVGKEAVVTSEAFDRADSTTLTVAGTPTGVTAQEKLGQFTSFNVNYGDNIPYGDFSSFLNAAGSVTISDKVNFATMKAGQKLIANFDVTMGTVSYKTGSMSEFKTIHSGDALDGVANDTAITFQIECGSGVTNTFIFTPHWASVEIPYNLAVKPISGDTVALTVGTDSANYVEYGVYASVPNGTTAMAIGAYDFELNYDTTAFDFESFTAADDTATVVVNKDTAGKANVGVTLNTAVTPEVAAAETGAVSYTALLGTSKLKVKSNTTTTTGVLTTSITNTTDKKPVVTPVGYDKNNGTITTKDHTQYLISFEYVGATGDASAWVLSGTTPTMPTATPKTGWSEGSWSPEAVAATEPATYTYTAHHIEYTVTWNGKTNPMTVTKTVYGTEGNTANVANGGTMYYEEALTVTPTITGDRTVIRNGDFKYQLSGAAATGVNRTGDTGFTYKVGPNVVEANVVLSYTTSEYVTVTFSGGTAVELKDGESAPTALDAITLKGTADKLYASVNDFIKGNEGTPYVIPTQVPKENARLVPPDAKTDATKQQWKIGATTDTVANSVLTAGTPSQVFTADTTLTADAVNTYAITFEAGEHGAIKSGETVTYDVDAGTTIADILAGNAKDYTDGTADGTPVVLPQTTPANGYKFKNWTAPESVTAVNAATTITGNFEVAKYSIGVSDNAAFKNLNGADATGKISMENDVTFKLMLKKNTRIESVSYTVAPNANGTTYEGATSVTLTADANGVYTIPKADILGDVTVTVQTVNTVTVTVRSADAGKGTVGGSTSFVVDKNSEVSAWDYSGLTTMAEPGYMVETKIVGDEPDTQEVTKFYYMDGDTLTEFTAEQFTAETTLYVKFVDATYDFAATEGLVTTGNGIKDNKVTHGTNANFTVNSINNIITSVTYSVEGGVQNVLLQPGTDDSYTIPGDRIIGKVTVTVKTLATEANINKPIKALFIKRDNEQVTTGEGAYMANVVQNSNMKILALVSEAFKATDYAGTSKFFQLADGTQLYWSDRYDAYVCWVSKTMTSADLDGFVKFDGSKTATAIVNGGDINFDSVVDSADAGIVNDALHGTRQVPTSALQLFEMDVANTSGKSYVNGATIDANDVTWILQKTVGKTVAKADNPLWAQPE